MARGTKTLKDDNGKDIVFYTDNCNICQKEMVFPKDEVDRIEEMFPFIKEKALKGSPCAECVTKDGKDFQEKIFTPEEIQMIKSKIMSMSTK